MKHFLSFSAILLLFPSLWLSAQNWQCIKTETISHFYSDLSEVYPIRIDSVYQHGDTTDYFGFRMIRPLVNGYDYFELGGHWTGNKFSEIPGGTYLFYNRNNREVRIETQAQLNDSWEVFRYTGGNWVEATVVETGIEEVLGIPDSVKTIQLRIKKTDGEYWSGASCGDSINMVLGCLLKLSKNYGFVTITDFYNFPFHPATYDSWGLYHESNMYHLIGIAEPELGFQNITAREIFDIHPGDELHINDINSMWGYGGFSMNKSIINKYLERDFTNNDDTLLFTIERCQRTEYTQYDGNSVSHTVNASKDTVTQKIVFSSPENLNLNLLPLEPFIEGGIATWFETSSIDNRKYYSSQIFDCYSAEHFTYINNDGDIGGYYIKGLGGPYHGDNGFFNTSIYDLVYFKKDNTEWGTPYDCDDLLNVGITAHTTSTIRIFPNPASDCIRIEGGNENQDFRLYSVAGECVLSGNTGSDSAINISHLAPGMYMLGIFTGQAWVNLRVLKL